MKVLDCADLEEVEASGFAEDLIDRLDLSVLISRCGVATLVPLQGACEPRRDSNRAKGMFSVTQFQVSSAAY